MFVSKVVCDKCKAVFTNQDQAVVSIEFMMHTCELFDDEEDE